MPLLQQLNLLFKRRILHAWMLHKQLFRASFRNFAGVQKLSIENLWGVIIQVSKGGRVDKILQKGGEMPPFPPSPRKMKFCCYDATVNCFGERFMCLLFSQFGECPPKLALSFGRLQSGLRKVHSKCVYSNQTIWQLYRPTNNLTSKEWRGTRNSKCLALWLLCGLGGEERQQNSQEARTGVSMVTITQQLPTTM